MDKLTKEQRSKLMGKIKSRDTKIEKVLYDPFIRLGMEYHPKEIYGKPDYAHRGTQIAVFIDGCFFHVCSVHCKFPATNVEFWTKKFERNRARDIEVNSKLVDSGWLVVRVWGHTIKEDPGLALFMLRGFVKRRNKLKLTKNLLYGGTIFL